MSTEEEQIIFTTDCDHYWEDKGIQKTGERNVRCRYCIAGMELDPTIPIIDGKIYWPVD